MLCKMNLRVTFPMDRFNVQTCLTLEVIFKQSEKTFGGLMTAHGYA